MSNRDDTASTLGNGEKSDSISTFQLGGIDTLAEIYQLWRAGGNYPRSFAINTAGDLVAVGLQMSREVVIMQRDVDTGLSDVCCEHSYRWGDYLCRVGRVRKLFVIVCWQVSYASILL